MGDLCAGEKVGRETSEIGRRRPLNGALTHLAQPGEVGPTAARLLTPV
jgi:hypothetical protein